MFFHGLSTRGHRPAESVVNEENVEDLVDNQSNRTGQFDGDSLTRLPL